MIGNGTPISHSNAPFPRPMTFSFTLVQITRNADEGFHELPEKLLCRQQVAPINTRNWQVRN